MSKENKYFYQTPFYCFICFAVVAYFFVYGAYFMYSNANTRNNVIKTYNDVYLIVRNMHEMFFHKKLKNINTATLVASNFIPFDLQISQNGLEYIVKNRFGGEVLLLEGLSNTEEKVLFISQQNNLEYYKQIYNGVGAFILYFSGINSRACQMLSQQKWEKIDGFLGLEISPLSDKKLYTGYFNLNMYLPGETIQQVNSKDIGIVSMNSLNIAQSENICKCSRSGCSFALKFK